VPQPARAVRNWNSTWRRFDRRSSKGVWARVFEALQDPDLEWLILDSTITRAHRSDRNGHYINAYRAMWDLDDEGKKGTFYFSIDTRVSAG